MCQPGNETTPDERAAIVTLRAQLRVAVALTQRTHQACSLGKRQTLGRSAQRTSGSEVRGVAVTDYSTGAGGYAELWKDAEPRILCNPVLDQRR